MTDNRTRLLALVTRELGSIVTTADDPIDAVLTTDLKGDSLHRISLICEIEEEFGIEVSDDDDAALGPDATLRTLLAMIECKVRERADA